MPGQGTATGEGPAAGWPRYRRRSPELRAVRYAPGLEEGWAVPGSDARTVLFFHPERTRAEAWAREHGHDPGRVLPALGGRGWEGEVMAIPPGHWLLAHPDGRREVMIESYFNSLYELVQPSE